MDRRTRPLEDSPDRRQPAVEVRDPGRRRQHGRNPSQKMVFLLKLWPLLPAANTDVSRPTQRFVLLTPQSITSTQDSLQESIPLKFVEIQPDRFGDQVTHLILRFSRHANPRKFRYIRPVGSGAVILYDDQISAWGVFIFCVVLVQTGVDRTILPSDWSVCAGFYPAFSVGSKRTNGPYVA